jgi:enolase-phosphatase E1
VSSTPAGLGAILLDIEGTVTPVSFVTRVLFPYARRHLRSYLEEHAAAPRCEAMLTRLRDEHALDLRNGEAVPPWADEPRADRVASAAAYVDWLMDRDRKSTALKELQGKIWEAGYHRAELVAEVFPDVRPALQRWQLQHLQVGIFSSGSVLAQQLLFRHSLAGDLTGFVQWYFDTHVGSKVEPDSYRRITLATGLPAEAFLFLSDIAGELDAASAAGMHVRLVIRPGNAPVAASHAYQTIRTLDEISLEAAKSRSL